MTRSNTDVHPQRREYGIGPFFLQPSVLVTKELVALRLGGTGSEHAVWVFGPG